ncbi:dynamin family protein [Thalassovita sp.]|uniref:dynamin family protein n=1 Tax=Thalassovita sp. TaxID=1979401 RepID=UPI0029DE6F15|nr:dynamin family protein [Thalassovita sp.]
MQDMTDRPQQQRKPRVALMGEFSAGKSTLLNMLLDDEPFPVKVTATRLPPVWTSLGADAAFVVAHDGTETPIEIEEISRVSLEKARLIRLHKQNDILELCDLIDMPGVSDPNMPAHVWLPLLQEIDIVIWCTQASQAWRQSEAAIWDRAREAMTGKSILLITQIDKLKTERDRNRVIQRVTRETKGLFHEVFPISTLQAMQSDDDPDLLEQSGAPAFLGHFVDLLFQPLAAKRKQELTWVTTPELPLSKAGSARVVHFTPAKPSAQDQMEPTEPPADTAMPDQPIVPRRVPRPSRTRTRPVRAEPRADGLA